MTMRLNYLLTRIFSSDVRSLALIFQTLEPFQVYSSLKLNLEKSEAC